MRSQAIVRAAAAVLSTAVITGSALAQASTTAPRSDVSPAPPEDRSSVGAIVMMDEPVIAQREQMQQMLARGAVDTRSMGAGPARLLRGPLTKEEIEAQKALDAAEFQKNGARALDAK
jgi:hypothetical protein